MENMRSLPVALPPIDEQRELAELIREQLDGIDEIDSRVAESESALTQLDQSILAKAFRGELVPQDPRDEPAAVLLERIRAARDTAAAKKQRRKREKAT